MRDNILETMNKIIKSKKEKAIISIKQQKKNQTIYVIHFLADIVANQWIGITLDLQKIEQTVTGYNLGLQEGKSHFVDKEFDYVNLRPKFSNPDSQDNMVYYNFINSGKDIQKSLNVQKRWARYRKNQDAIEETNINIIDSHTKQHPIIQNRGQDTKKEKECVEQPLRPPVQENKSEQHIQELEIDPKHKHVQKIIEKKKQERESKRNTGQAEIDVDALLQGFQQHIQTHHYQKEAPVSQVGKSQ